MITPTRIGLNSILAVLIGSPPVQAGVRCQDVFKQDRGDRSGWARPLGWPIEIILDTTESWDRSELGKLKPAPVRGESLQEAGERLWSDSTLSFEEKLELSFDLYLRERLLSLSKADRQHIKSILQDVHSQRGLDGAHYDELSRRIVIDNRITKDLIIYFDVLAHELEHAIQVLGKGRGRLALGHLWRLINPMPRVTEHTFRIEGEAIGAEWDFLQALPLKARQEGLRRLKLQEGIDPAFQALLEETIAAAGLPRQEFILKITTRTGYDHGRVLIREYGIKVFLYALMALALSDENDVSPGN